MLLTNWKKKEFLVGANKLNLKGGVVCRFSLQVVKYSWQETTSYRLSRDLDAGK